VSGKRRISPGHKEETKMMTRRYCHGALPVPLPSFVSVTVVMMHSSHMVVEVQSPHTSSSLTIVSFGSASSDVEHMKFPVAFCDA